ncbi:hypothetical protein GF373_08240 [bacterium]|nr:hypothetical protein [bacterium]
MKITHHTCLCLFTVFLAALFTAPFTVYAETRQPLPQVDDLYSIEGLPVSLTPPQGKILLLTVWDSDLVGSVVFTKKAIVTYKRFHDSGLNALGVVAEENEDEIGRFTRKWQIPWPLVKNNETDPALTQQLKISGLPAAFLVFSNGEWERVDICGEAIHAKIAEKLNVSLDDLPMPMAPAPRIEQPNPALMMRPIAGVLSKVFYVSNSFFGSPKEREDAESCKQHLRQISLAITKYRQEHNGNLPRKLDDLYPTYIKNRDVFTCPKHSGSPSGMGSEYLFEFTTTKHHSNNQTYRDWKTDQLSQFGDKVPVVRCLNHPRSLNLTYGGEILFYGMVWENDVPQGHTLNEEPAKIRERFKQIALALDHYKRAFGEVPHALDDLYPKYLTDRAILDHPLLQPDKTVYQFSPELPGEDGYDTCREWKMAQLKEYGGYVPILRARDILKNGNVINLAYNGEIWESSGDWEEDLTATAKKSSLVVMSERHRNIDTVLVGEEDQAIQRKNWPQPLIDSSMAITDESMAIPLRGFWLIREGGVWEQTNLAQQNSMLLAKPVVEAGEITLQAEIQEGQEGIRIIFGYQNSSHFYVWNIGGRGNTVSVIERWNGMQMESGSARNITKPAPFTLSYNEIHKMKLKFKADGQVSGFVDGKQILDYTFAEPIKGRMGVGTRNTKARFKDIVIQGSK